MAASNDENLTEERYKILKNIWETVIKKTGEQNEELYKTILSNVQTIRDDVDRLPDLINKCKNELNIYACLSDMQTCLKQIQSSIRNIEAEIKNIKENTEKRALWRLKFAELEQQQVPCEDQQSLYAAPDYITMTTPLKLGPNTVLPNVTRDKVNKAAREHAQLNEQCLQAFKSCLFSNNECQVNAIKNFDLFRTDVDKTLNEIREEILNMVTKQKEENNKKLEEVKKMIESQKILYAITHIEEAVAENDRWQLSVALKRYDGYMVNLKKLIQDISIKTYGINADRNVLDSLRKACRLDVYKVIKVCSLNVAGLAKRLRENKDKFEAFINEHEILCFTEINASENDNISDDGKHKIRVDGYKLYTKCRHQFQHRSGGIAIYIHEKLHPFVKEIDCECEYVLWIEIKDIFQTITDSVVLGVVYIPSTTSKFWQESMYKRFEDEVHEKCSTFRYVILTGDFNSYTGTLSEFTLNDALKDECKTFKRFSIPLERSSLDIHEPCPNGKGLIKLCEREHLFILNGRLFSDKRKGNITCWKTIPGSLIDYVIANDKCLELFKSFEVKSVLTEEYYFSDCHSALVFELGCHTLVYK